MDPYEENRVYSQILSIKTDLPECNDIKNQLMNDFSNGGILVWTSGEPDYDPNDPNVMGDTHNVPGIVHLTMNAFGGDGSNFQLQNTLIHEGFHRTGVLNDTLARAMEDLCFGV